GLSMIRLTASAERVAAANGGAGRGGSMAGLVEGLRFMTRTRAVALLMMLVAVYSVFGIPFLVLMPVFAQNVLHGNARTYGTLLAAVGIGAVLGALSFTRVVWLSVPLLALVGFAMIQNNALCNGLLQTLSPDHLRGRVMAAYA